MAQLRSVLVGLCLTIGTLLVSSLVAAGTLSGIRESTVSVSAGMIQGIGLIITDVTMVAVGAAYLRTTDRPILDYVDAKMPSRYDLKVAFIGFCSLIAALVALSAIVSFLDLATGQSTIAELIREQPSIVYILIPITIFSVAPAEEFLFRGIIQSRIREVFDEVPTILIAGAIFGVAHFFMFTGEGKAVSLTILTVSALIFAVAYEKADSLVAPILMHAAFNTLQFLRVYVEATGGA